MTDERRAKFWTVAGVVALVATVTVASKRTLERRRGVDLIIADEDLRDAVAEPAPTPSGLALARPSMASWFRSPGARHAQLDADLLSSRRRRARAQPVSLQ